MERFNTGGDRPDSKESLNSGEETPPTPGTVLLRSLNADKHKKYLEKMATEEALREVFSTWFSTTAVATADRLQFALDITNCVAAKGGREKAGFAEAGGGGRGARGEARRGERRARRAVERARRERIGIAVVVGGGGGGDARRPGRRSVERDVGGGGGVATPGVRHPRGVPELWRRAADVDAKLRRGGGQSVERRASTETTPSRDRAAMGVSLRR